MVDPIRRLGRDLFTIVRQLPDDAVAGPDDPRVQRAARSITELYAVMAAAVAIWVVVLAAELPERSLALHYDVTWVGFDLFLVATMAATAWWAHLVDPRVQLAANATATLLLVDAWMDVTTSSTTSAFYMALGMAIFLELPLAFISLRVARNVHRSLATRARLAGPGAGGLAQDEEPAAAPSGP